MRELTYFVRRGMLSVLNLNVDMIFFRRGSPNTQLLRARRDSRSFRLLGKTAYVSSSAMISASGGEKGSMFALSAGFAASEESDMVEKFKLWGTRVNAIELDASESINPLLLASTF